VKIRSYFLSLLVLLLLYSCTDTGNEEQADYFPNADGNWWEYQYSDSLTVRLELSGIETFGSTEVQRLIRNDEGEIDMDYLSKNETEIILYTSSYSWTAFTLARLPLREGNSWEAFMFIILGDTTTIIAYAEGKQSVSVPAGEFADCYPIYYENQTFEEPVIIYFAPDVGPVRFEYLTGRVEVLKDYEVE